MAPQTLIFESLSVLTAGVSTQGSPEAVRLYLPIGQMGADQNLDGEIKDC